MAKSIEFKISVLENDDFKLPAREFELMRTKSGKSIMGTRSDKDLDEYIKNTWMKMGSVVRQETQAVTRYFGRFSLQQLQWYFEPRNPEFKLGASGESADNFVLTEARDSVTITTGNKTEGNYFVRYGFTESKNWDGDRAKRKKVKLWLAAKGINLHTYSTMGQEDLMDYEKRNVKIKISGGTFHKVKADRFGNAYARIKRKSPEADQALGAVLHKLAAYGSKYSNLSRLYPVGKPYFDYGTYLMSKDTKFRSVLSRVENQAFVGVLKYLAYKEGNPTRYRTVVGNAGRSA